MVQHWSVNNLVDCAAGDFDRAFIFRILIAIRDNYVKQARRARYPKTFAGAVRAMHRRSDL